jgi:hypothetical protein
MIFEYSISLHKDNGDKILEIKKSEVVDESMTPKDILKMFLYRIKVDIIQLFNCLLFNCLPSLPKVKK